MQLLKILCKGKQTETWLLQRSHYTDSCRRLRLNKSFKKKQKTKNKKKKKNTITSDIRNTQILHLSRTRTSLFSIAYNTEIQVEGSPYFVLKTDFDTENVFWVNITIFCKYQQIRYNLSPVF
jgi:hypothetical protein